MSNTINSTYMTLPIPVVGVEISPEWATDLNNCLTIVDAHDHSPGYGNPVTPSGLNINADLPMGGNNATQLRSTRYTAQSVALAASSDIGCLYVLSADLYYIDTAGNQVRITQSGSVAGTPGSIANLVSPASASYVSADSTFVWQSAVATPAIMDCASVIIRNLSASAKGVTVQAPAALGANYSLVLPPLPASQKIMTLDSSGNMTAPYTVDASTIVISSNVIKVPASGITANELASSSVTTAKIAANAVTDAKIQAGGLSATSIIAGSLTATQMSSDINFPGSFVKENGKGLVVSNSNSTASIAIIRGAINGSAANIYGEGYTATRVSTGKYQVFYNNTFADVAVPVACAGTVNCQVAVTLVTSAACQFEVTQFGSPVDVFVYFQIMGTRN